MLIKISLSTIALILSALCLASNNYKITPEDQKQITIAAHDALSSRYLCDDNTTSHSMVEIDHDRVTLEENTVTAYGQVYYYCAGSPERHVDESCEFKKDLSTQTWTPEYCDH